MTAISKQAVERPKNIVKSSFCEKPKPIEDLPPLAPATTEEELEALFAQIDQEIDIDPELSQDLLDILNDEEEGEAMEEGYEEEQYDVNPKISKTPLTYYRGGDGFEWGDPDNETDEQKDKEDAEMEEMLAMIEAAKKDIEVVKEDDLMGMIENIDDDTYFEKIKPTTKTKVESSVSASQKRKQSTDKLPTEEISTKKRSVTSAKEQVTKVTETTSDSSVTKKVVKKVESEVSVSDSKVCDSVPKEEKKEKPKEKEKEKPKEINQLSKTLALKKSLAAKKAKMSE